MAELLMAEQVKSVARVLDRTGKLPPKPPGQEDILERMQVSINPHESILAIPAMMQGFSALLNMIGVQVVHNETNVPFLTSDNPVAYYDPDVPENRMRPYVISPHRKRIELFFPISPRLAIRGHSELRARGDFHHAALRSLPEVRRINRLIARFGYRFVFGSTNEHTRVIMNHAATSPVMASRPVTGSDWTFLTFEFTARPTKPKWRPDAADVH